MSDTPINEPYRYVKGLEARIRELEAQVAAQKALLDECERDLMNIVTLANGERNVDHYTRECLFKLRGEQQ